MGVARNLKRTVVAFGLEFTCIIFAYLGYLISNGVSITGSVLTDFLFFAFLSVLFALDYAVSSRYPPDEDEENDAIVPSGGTKKEQVLKYL